MRSTRFGGLVVCLALPVMVVAAEPAAAKPTPLAVAWKGEPKRIKFSLDKTAPELAHYLGLVLGLDVPRAKWDRAPAAETLLLLTDAAQVPEIRGELEGKPLDVFVIKYPFQHEGRTVCLAYKTRATQVLVLQQVIDSLRNGGRCGIVLDEGVLFRINETAFVETKRKLLYECDLWRIVTLPPGTFVNAGAIVKTDLPFFTKGQPTQRIRCCDLSGIKVRKKTPLTLAHFEEFFHLLPTRADSERSWTVDLSARRQHAAEEAEPFHRQARAKQHVEES